MNLPQRVQDDFAEMQHRSELLVTGVQLAVVALLAALYYAAPAGHAPDAPVRSAPLGLGLFAVLVLLRGWFAYTRQLTRPFLAFSVIAEMALLMFTIWTYHLQFEAMPNVNLKNTHIAYVFVLIALRSLRFEPVWVILSGLTAALGWGLIVSHALWVQGEAILTWDYVTYVSTRSLHPGGEFDKVLAILLVTFLSATMLKRARDTLFTAVAQTQATKDLSRFFDQEVASRITGADMALKAGQGERRQAAILFTDLRGFTKASAHLPPEGLIALLQEYQGLVVPIVRRHGGSIDKFMGDGVLASFGAVAASDTYAADVLRAVDELQEAAAAWSAERAAKGLPAVSIGAGVAVGEVVFGVIGFEDRLEYTVISETVNLAAKLEKHNKAEAVQALATASALALAQAQGYQSPSPKEIRPARPVGGVAGPLDLAVLA